MGKSLILAVKIIGDATDAIKAMDDAEGRTSKFASGMNTAAKWSAVGLGVLAAGAADAAMSASELQQAAGAVESVFKNQAGVIQEFAAGAADSVGLASSEYQNMAAVLGASLKNMGLEMDEVTDKTTWLIGLGADLAATYGGTTSEAVAALSSLLRGERDPIERYGVSIKQAQIDAQKAAMGLDDLTGAADTNANLLATLELLTQQTADAQGQFARESDTMAGSMQTMTAHFENAKAKLGEALLPILAEAALQLSEFAMFVQQNSEWLVPLVAALGGLAAAIVVINGAYKAFVAVQALQTAAQWAQNAAWLANPITWIILGIIATIALLVAGIVWVIQNWDALKEFGVAAWEAIVGGIKSVYEWITKQIAMAITSVVGWFSDAGRNIAAVWQMVTGWLASVRDALIGGLVNAVQGALNKFIAFGDWVNGILQGIVDWVNEAVSALAELAMNAVPGWAQDLFGMRSFSADMTLTERTMMVPEPMMFARSFAPADLGAMEAQVQSSFAAPVAYAAPVRVPAPRPQAQGTEVHDNRRYDISLPNYMGDKEEIIRELAEMLKRIEEEDKGLVNV